MLDRRVPRHLADEARVEEEPADTPSTISP